MEGRCSVNVSVPEVNECDISGDDSVVMTQPPYLGPLLRVYRGGSLTWAVVSTDITYTIIVTGI